MIEFWFVCSLSLVVLTAGELHHIPYALYFTQDYKYYIIICLHTTSLIVVNVGTQSAGMSWYFHSPQRESRCARERTREGMMKQDKPWSKHSLFPSVTKCLAPAHTCYMYTGSLQTATPFTKCWAMKQIDLNTLSPTFTNPQYLQAQQTWRNLARLGLRSLQEPNIATHCARWQAWSWSRVSMRMLALCRYATPEGDYPAKRKCRAL